MKVVNVYVLVSKSFLFSVKPPETILASLPILLDETSKKRAAKNNLRALNLEPSYSGNR